MGRGLGTLQRGILETLREYGDIGEHPGFDGYSEASAHAGAWSIGALADRLDGNHESVRRAVQALKARGLVDTARVKIRNEDVDWVRPMGKLGDALETRSQAIIGLAVWLADADVVETHEGEAQHRSSEWRAKMRARWADAGI